MNSRSEPRNASNTEIVQPSTPCVVVLVLVVRTGIKGLCGNIGSGKDEKNGIQLLWLCVFRDDAPASFAHNACPPPIAGQVLICGAGLRAAAENGAHSRLAVIREPHRLGWRHGD